VMRQAVAALHESPGDIVVLEPSCAAALRGDLPELVASTEAEQVATRVRTLAEVLLDVDLPLLPWNHDAVAQFHCHQRATFGTDADRALLSRLGANVTSVEDGCCGLAGNFGFEKGHYEISVTAAEQSFMPVLREHPEAEVLADGFSCRLQIGDLGQRRATHLAQLLRRHLDSAPGRIAP
jgi:Fe-S oxidoreductase